MIRSYSTLQNYTKVGTVMGVCLLTYELFVPDIQRHVSQSSGD